MKDTSSKDFQALKVQFALCGHAFARTDATDGSVSYFATRWGMSRHFPDLDAAKRFLVQIGGHHGV